MADTHSLFKKFNDDIKLTEPKKEELRQSREAIRDDIKTWLFDHDKGGSSFKIQGSFAMNTVINPLNDDEYDIDFGLYLNKYEDTDSSTWPKPATVHDWVLSAVDGRTAESPTNKNACVRVTYGHGYHVDIPIYIKANDTIYLAHLNDDWTESDVSGLLDWFNAKKDADRQLVRIIRYLKRWKDNRDVPLKGIELTILASENYDEATNRDDDATRYTVENIITTLRDSFSCIIPVSPKDDLFEGLSDTKRDTIFTELDNLAKKLQAAADSENQEIASEYLKDVFGDSFPKGESLKEAAAYVITSSPGVLKNDGRSG